jgi:lipopolysaccharide transport system ATP-binding protein
MKDSSAIIRVDNVSKKYCKSIRHVMRYGVCDTARDFLGIPTDSERLRQGEFWAVENLGFEVHKGETLGIIGPNGAGKTTVLKMLNGIFMPDKGKITVNGSVGALIELGAGFHPLLTGRENIYVNGAIMAMDKRTIQKRFDEIVDFAHIGDFLDTPVKHYSSGMYARLGFAVAVHSEPDILLVDEVLAVGDLEFTSKCSRKITQYVQNGGTMVFVSHSMQAIRNNVKRAILLSKGIIQTDGDVNRTCDYYESFISDVVRRDLHGERVQADSSAVITSVEFSPNDGIIDVGDDLIVKISYRCRRRVVRPVFTVSVFTTDYLNIVSSYSNLDGFQCEAISGDGAVCVNLRKMNLVPGKYLVSISFAEGEVGNILDWHSKMYAFAVKGDFHCYGFVDAKAKWTSDDQTAS